MSGVAPVSYWNQDTDLLLKELNSSAKGLSDAEAQERLKESAADKIHSQNNSRNIILFLRQFANPITILLIAASILSFFLGEKADAFIIIIIIFAGAILGFIQEKGAQDALKRLMQIVQVNITVLRDNSKEMVPIASVVPGDIVILDAGDTVPGDCRLIESTDLFANEAALTGETFPAEKKCCLVDEHASLHEKANTLFMGTHVVSGMAKAVVVKTGGQTEFGAISKKLRKMQPETEFEKGIHRFGYLLMEVTLMLVVLIFSFNVFLHKPILDSFLFSLAIAVGLTPQLLPAIISINLAKGASNMAKRQVIVKKLSAIDNFGSMNVLCSDKTGTITEGKVTLYQSVNYLGRENEKAFLMAYLNAKFESGFSNPIDDAIRNFANPDISNYSKKDELPYDFVRKRLSIVVTNGSENILITKGAFEQVLSICNKVDTEQGEMPLSNDLPQQIRQLFKQWSQEGYRVLGIATKKLTGTENSLRPAEQEMNFLGMLLFFDPPKKDARATIDELKSLGITLKIITGDNSLVAAHLSKELGLENPIIITGSDMRTMTDDALRNQAEKANIFAEVEPNQKERILVALKKSGNTVGFIGDGINDAPAIHTADVGISVSSAVDVAKDAADVVLLGSDLNVLISGVKEGRKTFANTLKYIFMATSANFGNMFSMAGASLFLPFLPLLPKQVLLTNLLTDIPEMTISSDRVDDVMVNHPRKMSISFIKKFMISFGILSSVFDYLTFGVLIFWFHAGADEFRTAWLVESVMSACLIVLVIRTTESFHKSLPGKYLLLSTILVVVFTNILPYTILGKYIGLVPLPLKLWAAILIIVALYFISAEMVKRLFYRVVGKQ